MILTERQNVSGNSTQAIINFAATIFKIRIFKIRLRGGEDHKLSSFLYFWKFRFYPDAPYKPYKV